MEQGHEEEEGGGGDVDTEEQHHVLAQTQDPCAVLGQHPVQQYADQKVVHMELLQHLPFSSASVQTPAHLLLLLLLLLLLQLFLNLSPALAAVTHHGLHLSSFRHHGLLHTAPPALHHPLQSPAALHKLLQPQQEEAGEGGREEEEGVEEEEKGRGVGGREDSRMRMSRRGERRWRRRRRRRRRTKGGRGGGRGEGRG